jgi:hypothetical protein
VRYLAQANTLVAVLGIQSSDRVNREVFDRHVSSETLIDVAGMLKRYNIVGQYDLIVQNPYETEEDAVEVCRTLSRLPKPYQLITFPLALFPNTSLRAKAIRDGIPVKASDGYETPYGSYPVKFPYLFRLQLVSAFLPHRLTEFFLRHRHSRLVRVAFGFYYHCIYRSIDAVRRRIIRSTEAVAWVKRMLFLPKVIANRWKGPGGNE